MGCIRPATPGFLITLIATALLAVVSFCVPYFKSVYFLRADITVGGNNGSITFGTLGYCVELTNGTTCSSPSIGYQLDINSLVGNRFSVEIPQVAVKWLTYALFLHVVALILAAGSALFGLLAHVREISMTCCSTCISGFAAGVALLAFIFDIALFFLAKARINAVGRATMGNAIWLTLAAWILLFFSGCFYTLGRCCISKRGPRNKWEREGDREGGREDDGYAERMRLDAVKAEADRKAIQNSSKGGLPAFHETQPLTGHVDGNSVYTDKSYKENESTSHGGYAPAPAGSRAVDEYYTPSPQDNSSTTYPPRPPTHPERQNSSTYTPSTYIQNNSVAAPQRQGSGFAPAVNTTSTFLNTQPTSPPTQYLYNDPYANAGRGHIGGSSYYSTTSHDQQQSSHSQYGYVAEPQPQQFSQPSFNADTYNMTSPLSSPPMPLATTTPSLSNPYLYNAQPPPAHNYTAPERSYTLSGDGYGANSVPPLPENSNYAYGASSNNYSAPINTNTGYVAAPLSPVKGPRQPPSHSHSNSSDAPPGYEIGASGMSGQWGKP